MSFTLRLGGRPRLMVLPAVHGEKYVSAAQLLKMRFLSNSQAMLQVWQCSYFSGFVCEVFAAHLYMVQWFYFGFACCNEYIAEWWFSSSWR